MEYTHIDTLKINNPNTKLFILFTNITGLAFYILGLFTLLNLLLGLLLIFRWDTNFRIYFSVLQIIFLLPIALNFFVGYGLIHRKLWVAYVVTLSFILLVALYLLSFIGIIYSGNIPSVSTIIIFGALSTILIFNRRELHATLLDRKVVASYVTVLFITVLFITMNFFGSTTFR